MEHLRALIIWLMDDEFLGRHRISKAVECDRKNKRNEPSEYTSK